LAEYHDAAKQLADAERAAHDKAMADATR